MTQYGGFASASGNAWKELTPSWESGMKKQAAPKTKRFEKIYKDLFKTMDELRADKITPKQAKKKAKAVKERIKKL